MSITRLTAGTKVTRQAVTKHLEEAGRYLEVISRQWDEALDRLKASVEG